MRSKLLWVFAKLVDAAYDAIHQPWMSTHYLWSDKVEWSGEHGEAPKGA
jgi:hypothetical protein